MSLNGIGNTSSSTPPTTNPLDGSGSSSRKHESSEVKAEKGKPKANHVAHEDTTTSTTTTISSRKAEVDHSVRDDSASVPSGDRPRVKRGRVRPEGRLYNQRGAFADSRRIQSDRNSQATTRSDARRPVDGSDDEESEFPKARAASGASESEGSEKSSEAKSRKERAKTTDEKGTATKFIKSIGNRLASPGKHRRTEKEPTRTKDDRPPTPGSNKREDLIHALPDEIREGFLMDDLKRAVKSGEAFVADPHMRSLFVDSVKDEDGILLESRMDLAVKDLLVLLDVEGNDTKQSGEVQRSNTPFTAYVSAYLRRVGAEYATNVLYYTVHDIQQQGRVEIDPHRLLDKDVYASSSEGADKMVLTPEDVLKIYKEAQKLETIVNGLMSRLCESSDDMPQEICDLAATIYQKVKAQPGMDVPAARNAVTGAVVLRLLNPVLANPQGAPEKWMFEGYNETTRRTMILVSSVFQAIANGADPSRNKRFMDPMSAVWSNHLNDYNNFLDRILDRGRPL